ncbi:hypothetical protein STENM223S_05877 [Streptomyces tendae]
MPRSSSGDSRSPSSSALWISALIRSSPGCRRLPSTSVARYCAIEAAAALRTSGSEAPMASFDQVRNDSRSKSGTPRSSQITEMGSGKDNASTRSARPSGAASIRSSSASVVFWMRGASSSTRRVVNSRATSLRSRVWSGGSARSMCGPEETAPNGRSGEALLQSFESLGSVRAARPTSCPTTSQASAPPSGIRMRCTGPRARNRAYTG